jgi:hypothetical protein
MKAEHGETLVHPMMYVSALHNSQWCYPVNQYDAFFTGNGIRFLELPARPEPFEMTDEPAMKFMIIRDELGTYPHAIVKNDAVQTLLKNDRIGEEKISMEKCSLMSCES